MHIFFDFRTNFLIFADFFYQSNIFFIYPHSPSLPLMFFPFPFNCIEGFFLYPPSLSFHCL